MYWRIRAFQELEHLSAADREKVLAESGAAQRQKNMIARAGFIGMLIGTILQAVLFSMLLRLPRYVMDVGYLLACLLFAAIIYQLSMIRFRGEFLTYLEKTARQRRLPMCLKCGYNLTGIASERCPECGSVLTPVDPPRDLAAPDSNDALCPQPRETSAPREA